MQLLLTLAGKLGRLPSLLCQCLAPLHAVPQTQTPVIDLPELPATQPIASPLHIVSTLLPLRVRLSVGGGELFEVWTIGVWAANPAVVEEELQGECKATNPQQMEELHTREQQLEAAAAVTPQMDEDVEEPQPQGELTHEDEHSETEGLEWWNRWCTFL
jgi:hypothetical protein